MKRRDSESEVVIPIPSQVTDSMVASLPNGKVGSVVDDTLGINSSMSSQITQ